MKLEKPIIFFDGVCHLCNAFVDKVVQKDKKAHFQFAPLQGETARSLLTSEEQTQIESVILLDHKKKFKNSHAILKILISLGGFYQIFVLGYILPACLRDRIYRWLARHRYQWFGQREFCRIPDAHEKERFLP